MDPTSLPGTSKFVAAFAQSNEGDVSPNTRGPHCIDTGTTFSQWYCCIHFLIHFSLSQVKLVTTFKVHAMAR